MGSTQSVLWCARRECQRPDNDSLSSPRGYIRFRLPNITRNSAINDKTARSPKLSFDFLVAGIVLITAAYSLKSKCFIRPSSRFLLRSKSKIQYIIIVSYAQESHLTSLITHQQYIIQASLGKIFRIPRWPRTAHL